MTRSLRQLWLGHGQESLCWHPFAVPLFLLFLLSLGWVAVAFLRRQELLLPRGVSYLWVALLLGGWLLKFIFGPAYW
jgi:hypothetical protein